MGSKTAVLIQTHNNASYIVTLALHNPGIMFFVHVDLKFDSVFYELKKANVKNISLLEDRVSVFWGGISQIHATLKLLKASVDCSNFLYYHLISGECLPLISFCEMEKEWNLTPQINFMESRKRHDNEWRVNTWLPHADSRHMRTFFGRVLKRILRVISSHIKTTKISDEVYYGSQWFSINRELACKILSAQHDNYFDYFKHITCSDEHALQMLARKIKDIAIADDNRRFIQFSDGASSPLYLDIKQVTHANDNVDHKFWFARKLHEDDMINFLTNKK